MRLIVKVILQWNCVSFSCISRTESVKTLRCWWEVGWNSCLSEYYKWKDSILHAKLLSYCKVRQGMKKPAFSFTFSATAAIFSAVIELRAQVLLLTSQTCNKRSNLIIKFCISIRQYVFEDDKKMFEFYKPFLPNFHHIYALLKCESLLHTLYGNQFIYWIDLN